MMDLSGFRDVPGFPNYMVDRTGRVWSKPRTRGGGRLLKPTNEKRILTVGLYRGAPSVRHPWAVGALVLTVFVGARPEGLHMCHVNGDFRDCRVENLRWGTPKDNVADSIKHGTHASLSRQHVEKMRSFVPRGKGHWTNQQPDRVRRSPKGQFSE